LGVEDHLEQEVAEFLGQCRRRSGLERVIDLVRLLEEVLAQRFVGLLLIPWAAVRSSEALADIGHRPRAGVREFGGHGCDEERPAQVMGTEVADRCRVTPCPADDVVRGVQPAENHQRIPAPGSVPTGQQADGGGT
jgi:hypothetical protein